MGFEISDRLMERIRFEAEEAGVSPEDYVEGLLPGTSVERRNGDHPQKAPPDVAWNDERWREWQTWVEDFNSRVKMGPIPEGAFSVESLYEADDAEEVGVGA